MLIAESDTVSCSKYGERNGLLDEKEWTRFKRISNKSKQLKRMTHQCKLRSYRNEPSYKLGVPIPKSHEAAARLDAEHGDERWKVTEEIEIRQMQEYGVFEELDGDLTLDTASKRIKVHFVYDVKHDGRHKARLVAGGHLTDPPTESVYSSVVSLRGLRIILFLAE